MRDELKNFLASKYDPDKFIQFISNRFYGFEQSFSNETDEDLNVSYFFYSKKSSNRPCG